MTATVVVKNVVEMIVVKIVVVIVSAKNSDVMDVMQYRQIVWQGVSVVHVWLVVQQVIY